MVWNQQPLYYEWEDCLAKWTKYLAQAWYKQAKETRNPVSIGTYENCIIESSEQKNPPVNWNKQKQYI